MITIKRMKVNIHPKISPTSERILPVLDLPLWKPPFELTNLLALAIPIAPQTIDAGAVYTNQGQTIATIPRIKAAVAAPGLSEAVATGVTGVA